jgi:hypothetical protein
MECMGGWRARLLFSFCLLQQPPPGGNLFPITLLLLLLLSSAGKCLSSAIDLGTAFSLEEKVRQAREQKELGHAESCSVFCSGQHITQTVFCFRCCYYQLLAVKKYEVLYVLFVKLAPFSSPLVLPRMCHMFVIVVNRNVFSSPLSFARRKVNLLNAVGVRTWVST